MKYVAFLRGINVGGKNKIKMETLREICAALGFENVKTYVNSGNIIFETAKTTDKKTAVIIESAIEKEFALKIKVIVRTMAEIAQIIAGNPFAGQFEDDKDLHVFFWMKNCQRKNANCFSQTITKTKRLPCVIVRFFVIFASAFRTV